MKQALLNMSHYINPKKEERRISRCVETEEKKDKAHRLRKNKNQIEKEDYEILRNKYMDIRREAKKGYHWKVHGRT